MKNAAAAALAVSLIAACGGDGATDPDEPEAPAAADGTVVLTISQQPASMLPLRLDVNAGNWRAFEGLLDYDADLELVPRLAAEMPAVSDDGRMITVLLRTDVTSMITPSSSGSPGWTRPSSTSSTSASCPRICWRTATRGTAC